MPTNPKIHKISLYLGYDAAGARLSSEIRKVADEEHVSPSKLIRAIVSDFLNGHDSKNQNV